MPQNKDLRRLVRTRMAATGENYTQALAHLQDRVVLEPLPAAWGMTGSRAPDYEAGLLTGAGEDEDRIAQLRLRAAVFESAGFGSVVQAIAAARYLGRRVCFSALIRTAGVTGWAGLWLRVDGSAGPLILDNMHDRALRGTTDWTGASIVLAVAEHAKALLFGALLSGAGTLDLTRLRFEEVDAAVPTTAPATAPATAHALPDEPQALDFSPAW